MMGDLPFPGQGMEEQMLWKRQMGDSAVPLPGPPGTGKEKNSNFYKARVHHNEAELRELPQEGQQLYDSRSRSQDMRGPPPGSPGNRKGDSWQQMGPQEKAGVRSTPYKSRLCTRFMQKGDCPYGPTCHFAHGYEDLHTPEGQRQTPGNAMEGHGFDMPFPRPGMMMQPGGPMMPPDFMAMAAMAAMPGGPMMPARPRPPPGPPPVDRSGGSLPFSPDQQGFSFDLSRTPTRLPASVPYLDRVKASCVLLGVGTVRPVDAGPEAMEAAMIALQTGEAFEVTSYADALDMAVH